MRAVPGTDIGDGQLDVGAEQAGGSVHARGVTTWSCRSTSTDQVFQRGVERHSARRYPAQLRFLSLTHIAEAGADESGTHEGIEAASKAPPCAQALGQGRGHGRVCRRHRCHCLITGPKQPLCLADGRDRRSKARSSEGRELVVLASATRASCARRNCSCQPCGSCSAAVVKNWSASRGQLVLSVRASRRYSSDVITPRSTMTPSTRRQDGRSGPWSVGHDDEVDIGTVCVVAMSKRAVDADRVHRVGPPVDNQGRQLPSQHPPWVWSHPLHCSWPTRPRPRQKHRKISRCETI